MSSVLVHLDEPTLAALDQVAPRGKRAAFIRQAIKDALRKREFDRMREAYVACPNSAGGADDWPDAEEWKD